MYVLKILQARLYMREVCVCICVSCEYSVWSWNKPIRRLRRTCPTDYIARTIFEVMMKNMTHFLIIFFVFQQLQSQISKIDKNGYHFLYLNFHMYCNISVETVMLKKYNVLIINDLQELYSKFPVYFSSTFRCCIFYCQYDLLFVNCLTFDFLQYPIVPLAETRYPVSSHITLRLVPAYKNGGRRACHVGVHHWKRYPFYWMYHTQEEFQRKRQLID